MNESVCTALAPCVASLGRARQGYLSASEVGGLLFLYTNSAAVINMAEASSSNYQLCDLERDT